MFGNNFFTDNNKSIDIPESCKVIWVSDFYTEDLPGGAGAELSNEALLENTPLEVFKIRSKDITMDLLEKGHQKFWVFTNFTQMDFKLIPSIIANMKYSIVEYDFKYCRYRLKQLHMEAEKTVCNCHNEVHGKLISSFYHGAKTLYWMSQIQMDEYFEYFPFLKEKSNVLLSSIFDKKTLALLKQLILNQKEEDFNDSAVILGSNSWIKNTQGSINYCDRKNIKHEVVQGLKYEDLLIKLSKTKYGIFMPLGMDSCSRLSIEMALLCKEVVFNDNVIQKDEEWMSGNKIHKDSLDKEFGKDIAKKIRILEYLYSRKDCFWDQMLNDMNHVSTISSYLTVYNCIEQEYCYEKTIDSMTKFSDEVIILDGGSTDGTFERIKELATLNNKIKIYQEKRDWKSIGFSLFDGQQKALARSFCTGDFCVQMDADEYFEDDHCDKLKHVINNFPEHIDLIALPVKEFWGDKGKIRIDINPWKQRISRNKKYITHGIRKDVFAKTSTGRVYVSPPASSDGCEYINKETLEPISFGHFMTAEAEQVRRMSLTGNNEALESYSNWLRSVYSNIPTVTHESWKDIKRKIKVYKNTWSWHWMDLYNVKIEDTSENNMFFNKKWSDVSDKDIEILALELENKMGGWIFHSKLPDFINDETKRTPWIYL